MSVSPRNNLILSLLVLIAAICASISSYLYFSRLGVTNIYGDGLYHLNTARKMVDSSLPTLWDRYVQLGSPWLPLPHLLMLPFIGKDYMWRTGLAGGIVSMISFVIAAFLVYKLALAYYSDRTENAQRVALISAAIFIFNPSNLYMQTTPMTELPFMVIFVAGIFALQIWAMNQKLRWLMASAFLLTLGTITRYEGWALLPFAGITVLLASNRIGWRKLIDGGIWGIIAAVGPVYWFWHNWAIYGNALEFYNGPYSARGIYGRSNGSYDWVNVSYHSIKGSLLVAAVTAILCVTLAVFVLGISGYITEIYNRFAWRPASRKRFVIDAYVREFIAKRQEWSRYLPTFLLIIPFCFLVYSLYRNEIQIIPLVMISLYNVRYGLMHLIPAAIFAPAVIFLCNAKRRGIVLALVGLVVALQYGIIAHDGLLKMEIVQEPLRNNVNSPEWRNKEKLDKFLLEHPPKANILMESGYLGSSVLKGGLQFRDIIYDGDARFYKIDREIPSDVQTVIMKDGDSLWQKFHDDPAFNKEFHSVFTSPGNPILIVYERKNPS